jgi:hypothetical protein
MKARPINRVMWAYFSPSGYIQVRTIADSKKLSRTYLGNLLSWQEYEESGYFIKQVIVNIKEAIKYKSK